MPNQLNFRSFLCTAGALSGLLLAANTSAAPPPGPQLQQMMRAYSPELKQRVMQLSPETKQAIAGILKEHDRRSQQVTFRQVMHEVLADFQAISAAIATDNAEAAAEAARRLANHRLPRGGLFPYFRLEQINDADMSLLPAMNAAVEGNARKLAEAAERGDMAGAAGYLSEVMGGCVACHQHFRGQPGASELLLEPEQALK